MCSDFVGRKVKRQERFHVKNAEVCLDEIATAKSK